MITGYTIADYKYLPPLTRQIHVCKQPFALELLAVKLNMLRLMARLTQHTCIDFEEQNWKKCINTENSIISKTIPNP